MKNIKIVRFSNVELLDLIRNCKDNSLLEESKLILKKRNLSQVQKEKLEYDYAQFKELQEKRKQQPLTNNEWITFFILPFFTPRPKWREDHFTESELERFKSYGFEKKLNQAQKIRKYGYAFWFVIFFLSVLLIILFDI